MIKRSAYGFDLTSFCFLRSKRVPIKYFCILWSRHCDRARALIVQHDIIRGKKKPIALYGASLSGTRVLLKRNAKRVDFHGLSIAFVLRTFARQQFEDAQYIY